MGFTAFDTKHKNYNDKSCSSLEKAYYRPIEAALRWCGLVELESAILEKLQGGAMPAIYDFPQWPCLRLNAEKIFDAIENNEIPHGRDGKTVSDNDHVAPARVTIRHTDLKLWVAKHFPDQKPDFLFGELERSSHTSINADSFRALQADRDALRLRVEAAEKWFKENNGKLAQAEADLKKRASASVELSTTERNTLLKIIAGMAIDSYGFDPKAARSEVAKKISDDIFRHGIKVTDDTIRKWLKIASEVI